MLKILLFIVVLFSRELFAADLEDPNDQEKCPTESNSPYQWDNDRSRCVLRKPISEAREEFKKCSAITDEDKRKECLENNRNQLAGEEALTIDDPLEGRLSTITSSVPLSFLVVSAVTKKASGQRAGCTSKTIFKYASIAGVGVELYFRFLAKRKFKRLQEEYEELGEKDPYVMQIAAFKFLEEQQEEVARIAGRQKTFYRMLGMAYVSSATLAVLESATLLGLKPCGGSTGGDSADGDSPARGPGLSRMFNLLGHSPGIAILSGIMTALYGVLAKGADKASKEATERAAIIRETREQFEAMYSSSGHCPKRDELAKPHCYCYNDDGQRNPLRTNSQTCKDLWAFYDRDLFAEADNPELAPWESPTRQGCVNLNQEFDLDCKCLKIVNEAGENFCYKATLPSNILSSLPPNAATGETLNNLSRITDGEAYGVANHGGGNGKKAARANVHLKQVLKKQDELNGQKGHPPVGKILSTLNKGFKNAAKNLTASASPFGLNHTAAHPKNLKGNIKKSLKNKKVKKALGKRSSSTATRKGKKKSSAFNESAAHAPKIMGDFMEKDYDYSKANDDIVDKKGVTLWAIISNRYVVTGLARLFGQEDE